MSKEGIITETDLRESRSRAVVALEQAKANDEGKISLRIDKNIVILIRPDQCPITAAKRFKERMKQRKQF